MILPTLIYTDGSILDNTKVGPDTPASWAFVVVRGGMILEEKSGLVITDSWHKDYVGAEIGSNNTAELTAIIQGALSARLNNYKDTVIVTDSRYAMDAIRGRFALAKNITLVLFARQTICIHDSIKMKWVKGHAGDPFNERADELAKKVLLES